MLLLEVVPISFREEICNNEKVVIDLYPTEGSEIFDVFIERKEVKCFLTSVSMN